MFKRGDKWLTDKMYASGSEVVEYITGNVRRLVRSQFAITFYEMADTNGMLIKKEVRDFIIKVELLVGEPKRGDIIIYEGQKYIVTPHDGTDVYKFCDAFKKKYRIHSKRF